MILKSKPSHVMISYVKCFCDLFTGVVGCFCCNFNDICSRKTSSRNFSRSDSCSSKTSSFSYGHYSQSKRYNALSTSHRTMKGSGCTNSARFVFSEYY